MANEIKKLLIIDSNSVIHRAFHALPFLTTKKGEETNAIYGFLLVFLRAIKDFEPDYIAATFDLPFLTFRHKKFKGYKAKRPLTPESLSNQIPKIKKLLKCFNVPVFEKKGFEADDVIGTIAFLSKIETIILSGDLDVLQLINLKTKVYFLRKGVKDIVLYDKQKVREKFQGLTSAQILDFKALKGDSSDNIPGATGIGEKTAFKLLLEFKNLDNLYKEIEKNSKKAQNLNSRIKEILLKNKKQVFLSRELIQINRKVPLDFEIEKCFWKNYDKEKVSSALKEFEFYSLINRLPLKEKEIKTEEERKLTLW